MWFELKSDLIDGDSHGSSSPARDRRRVLNFVELYVFRFAWMPSGNELRKDPKDLLVVSNSIQTRKPLMRRAAATPGDLQILEDNFAEGGLLVAAHRSAEAEAWVDGHHDDALLKRCRAAGVGGRWGRCWGPADVPAIVMFGSIRRKKVLGIARRLAEVSGFSVLICPLADDPVLRRGNSEEEEATEDAESDATEDESGMPLQDEEAPGRADGSKSYASVWTSQTHRARVSLKLSESTLRNTDRNSKRIAPHITAGAARAPHGLAIAGPLLRQSSSIGNTRSSGDRSPRNADNSTSHGGALCLNFTHSASAKLNPEVLHEPGEMFNKLGKSYLGYNFIIIPREDPRPLATEFGIGIDLRLEPEMYIPDIHARESLFLKETFDLPADSPQIYLFKRNTVNLPLANVDGTPVSVAKIQTKSRIRKSLISGVFTYIPRAPMLPIDHPLYVPIVRGWDTNRTWRDVLWTRLDADFERVSTTVQKTAKSEPLFGTTTTTPSATNARFIHAHAPFTLDRLSLEFIGVDNANSGQGIVTSKPLLLSRTNPFATKVPSGATVSCPSQIPPPARLQPASNQCTPAPGSAPHLNNGFRGPQGATKVSATSGTHSRHNNKSAGGTSMAVVLHIY
ncbi:hypothetical protein FB451DRAFT_1364054 [Mycena latifolia]|nr:hypothetical protein FB451DRAFT_1364054 [Mycena latifolia]